MELKRIKRRHFLVGATGFMLPLPTLLSLGERSANAQSPALPKRFYYMNTEHGCVRTENMFPPTASLVSQLEAYPGHVIRHGALVPVASGNSIAVSPVLTAPSSVLTPALLKKMNVIAGLDMMISMGHHHAAYLGNLLDLTTEKDPKLARPTIDQVMAWSPSFYGNATVRKRSMLAGSYLEISKTFSNPQSPGNDVVNTPEDGPPAALFDKLFDAGPKPPVDVARTPVVDRVLEHWQGVRGGRFGDAGRLSSDDRHRIDDHLARLAELQRSLSTLTSPECRNQTAPDVPDGYLGGEAYSSVAAARKVYQAYNQVIAAAFSCDASRIGVCRQDAKWSDTALDWHASVAHMARSQERQALLVGGSRLQFSEIFLDLAQRLDAIADADGSSVLDNSLLVWGQEAGFGIHDFFCSPITTFGSAGGALQTGQFIDYRNVAVVADKRAQEQSTIANDASAPAPIVPNPGLPYNRFLATALLAMGVPASEWQRAGEKGYGHPRNDFPEHYTSAKVAQNGDPLPFLSA